jgi:vacuolar-type H+-ATPase subunit C/Vma6
MTPEQEKDLAEAVLRTRGLAFGAANREIKEAVEKILAEYDFDDVFNRIVVRDYRKLLLSLPAPESNSASEP